MTNLNVTPAAAGLPRGAISIHRAVSAVEDVIYDVRAWQRRRTAAKQLAMLPKDRQADLGIDGVRIQQLGKFRR